MDGMSDAFDYGGDVYGDTDPNNIPDGGRGRILQPEMACRAFRWMDIRAGGQGRSDRAGACLAWPECRTSWRGPETARFDAGVTRG
jgi:hypothetical protein